MAKHDWKALQAAYLADNAETGITAQQWCEEHGLNYQSARRYIKPRSAQSAQKEVRKTAQSAQVKRSAQKCAKGDTAKQKENDVAAGAHDADTDAQQPETEPQRDASGRFAEGNKLGGNYGVPANAFQPGNQIPRKHSAYSRYLDADELFDAASESDLHDELIFTRARALSVTKTLNKIMEDLQNAADVETRIELYDKLLKAEQGLDRNIARIESIENSLSRQRLDAINGPRLSADTLRIKAATAKLKAETEKLTAESKDVTTPLTDVVRDIHAMPDDGMLAQ
ncbi:terminase [Dickeya oryzae]|uniref:terminase n=1 Tax=Dickeya oryzae TaxID=1240404 RepID=UPI001AECD54F|nr:terminase [Dickeya oryzae]MBP2845425.1 terminase [Dickeya oryzae]